MDQTLSEATHDQNYPGVLSPMEPEDFGGHVRSSFTDDYEYQRAHAREQFLREMAQWREMQGDFHGRPAEEPAKHQMTDYQEDFTAHGPSEPQTTGGVAPGVGPRGEMLGCDWNGPGREPAMGPMSSATETHEERTMTGQNFRS